MSMDNFHGTSKAPAPRQREAGAADQKKLTWLVSGRLPKAPASLSI